VYNGGRTFVTSSCWSATDGTAVGSSKDSFLLSVGGV
jgi:hypothetical protein